MLAFELEEVEIDFCPRCQRLWLDAGELELISKDSVQEDKFITSITGALREKGRKCPICRKRMLKVASGEENEIILDQCPGGHGFWFDEGELYQILNIKLAPQDSQILNLLKQMFAHKMEREK
jgi:Zn-finger nucleic acid-binding protein